MGGRPVHIRSPLDAQALGAVGLIHACPTSLSSSSSATNR
jgi:hypothetical protein